MRPVNRMPRWIWPDILPFVLLASTAYAQLSPMAYRVLGQPDMSQNGLNMVQGTGLHTPSAVALDFRGGQTHIYIVDTANHRVLAWPDVTSYQIGASPAIILGQPSAQSSVPYGIGSMGFNSPTAAAVDPLTGNLFVSDTGNNRVLLFAAPFLNPGVVQPGAVYGEPDFVTFKPSTVSASTLSAPTGVAVDALGNLWVSDSGNHRILRFPAGSSAPARTADTVLGQKDFISNSTNAGGSVSASGLNTPGGLAIDGQGNLYVADTKNARVLRFVAPLGPAAINAAATVVWGQNNFSSGAAPQAASASTVNGPVGVCVDNSGNLYVATPADNRVLMFPPGSGVGSSATSVFGQPDMVTTTPNSGTTPFASPNTLWAPRDVKVDSSGNVFVADAANNRVVAIPHGTRSATLIWGQTDFTLNGGNQIKPGSISFAYSMAIDYSQAPFALYVSDTNNNRVLVWKDSAHFQSGDPADLVIGQPSLLTALANVDSGPAQTPSMTSLSAPTGIVVDPASGTLYVADSGNNRVLRFPRPVAQGGRITPDAVIGQVNFTTANASLVSGSSLNSPGGLAIGPSGELFVADTGDNRVLEFGPGAGNGASAVRVYGQPNMSSSIKPNQMSAQTLRNPQGIYVDRASNLYVADSGANRVVIYPNTGTAPAAGAAAAYVIGQAGFNTSSTSSSTSFASVTLDSNGNVYVSDFPNNRVLIFSQLIFLPISGATPTGVIGQPNLSGTTANWDSSGGLATADGLFGPFGLYMDRQDTLYVGDVGNNRVMHFLKNAVVVNAATFQTGVPVARGGLATLGGGGLVNGSATASGTSWPTTLLNRQIVINGQLAAPIYYMGQNQANFQVPSNAPLGTVPIAVITNDTSELIAGGPLLIAAASPGLFTSTQNGTGQGAVVNQDGTINSAANPAPSGSTVSLYGTGQGQVSPAVLDGTAAPASPLSNTVAVPTSDPATCLNNQPSMCVAVGSNFGVIKYSGLAPGNIGLWQINVTIPAGTPSGSAVGVRVVISGMTSNLVTIAVR